MPQPELPPTRLGDLHHVADRFILANRVSLYVGFVLTLLLFGLVALGLGWVIPAPFGLAIGGSIAGAGLLLLLFLSLYAYRTFRRPPYAAWATVEDWRETHGRHGEVSYGVRVHIEEARALTPRAWGPELEHLRGKTVTPVLVSSKLSGKAPRGRPVLMVCVPTGEVVAFVVEGALHSG